MVYTFWSLSPGSGASFTAINTARILSNSGIECILIDFDLINSCLPTFFNYNEDHDGIDDLIPYAFGGNLTHDMLVNITRKSGNIVWLSGSRHPEQCYFYRTEDLSALIDTAKEMYQIVLIDTSGFPNNAGTYTALKSADRVFLVTDGDMIKIRRFDKVRAIISAEIDKNNMSLVLNKAFSEITPDSRDAAAFFNTVDVFELPDLGHDFIRALNNGKWLEFMQNNKGARYYNNALENLIKTRISDIAPSKFLKGGDTIARKGFFSAFKTSGY